MTTRRKIPIPYDLGHIELDLPEERLNGVLKIEHKDECRKESPEEIIRTALANPIDSEPLHRLAAGKQRVVIITSDHTRPLPSALTLPFLLSEIRRGNPDADITIIVATGLHRGMTAAEMDQKFGADLCRSERIVNHDAFDKSRCVNLGDLPSGSKCEINRLAVDADLLIAEGFIEPHFLAGFSGGRKSVLPGIASQDCVNINHSARAIAHPDAATGVLDGNPIHEDMIQAARFARLAFILNVLLDDKKQVIAAYSGDVDSAHRAGCEYLLEHSGVDPIRSDIVVTSNGGYPLDQNLYQCPKGLDTALASAKEDSVIILIAACRDGLGGENFGSLMQEGTPHELLDRVLGIPPEKTISEQWCVQCFADALIRHRIILVTSGLDRALVENMNFMYADTVETALEEAEAIKGADAGITVIPDGVSVIVRR